jgi:hypothetical protein
MEHNTTQTILQTKMRGMAIGPSPLVVIQTRSVTYNGPDGIRFLQAWEVLCELVLPETFPLLGYEM